MCGDGILGVDIDTRGKKLWFKEQNAGEKFLV